MLRKGLKLHRLIAITVIARSEKCAHINSATATAVSTSKEQASRQHNPQHKPKASTGATQQPDIYQAIIRANLSVI